MFESSFPSVLSTCFNLLSKRLWFYCTSVLPPAKKGGLMGDMCPVVSLPNRWEIIEVIQSVLCVCEQERKKKRKSESEAERCYHLALNP